MIIDLYDQVQHAVWEGRWLAIVSIWNAMLAQPWLFIVAAAAIMLEGRRAALRMVRWVGLAWWHHAQD